MQARIASLLYATGSFLQSIVASFLYSESQEKIYRHYIKTIIVMNAQRIYDPQDILFILLREYKQSCYRQHNSNGLFKTTAIKHEGFINKLIQLRYYNNADDYILTVIRHLKDYHNNMQPTDYLPIILSAFFSIYEGYQAHLTTEIINKLMLRYIWDEMISKWIDQAIDSAQICRHHRRELLFTDVYQPNYNQLYEVTYPEDKKLENKAMLLGYLDTWIPSNNIEPLINYIIDTKRIDEDKVIIYRLEELKAIFSHEQNEYIVKILLSYLDTIERPDNSLLDVLYHFRGYLPPEAVCSIQMKFHTILIASTGVSYREWIKLDKLSEIINAWVNQTSSAYSDDERTHALKQLTDCKSYIPLDEIKVIIENAISSTVILGENTKNLRRAAFRFLCRFRENIPTDKHKLIIESLLHNLIQYNTFTPNEIPDLLNTLNQLMSHEDMNLFINNIQDILFNNPKLMNNVDNFSCTVRTMCVLIQYFSDEKFSILMSWMKTISSMNTVYIDLLYTMMNSKEIPSSFHSFIANVLMDLIPDGLINEKTKVKYSIELYKHAAYLSDDNLNKLISHLFKDLMCAHDNNDYDVKTYSHTIYLFKWMSGMQKVDLISRLILCINSYLTALEQSPSSLLFTPTDVTNIALIQLIKFVTPEMTQEQHAKTMNLLINIITNNGAAIFLLNTFLESTRNINQKTAVLSQLSVLAEQGDAKMKKYCIGAYVSYKNDIARSLVNKAFYQQQGQEIPEELSQIIMRCVR